MDNKYFKTERIKVELTYDISYNKEDIKSRNDAMELIKYGCMDASGCSIHGCFGAKFIRDEPAPSCSNKYSFEN